MRVGTEKAQLLAVVLQQELAKRNVSRLPTVRELAGSYHVSPVTILQALRILVDKGVIRRSAAHRSYHVAGNASHPDTFVKTREKLASRDRIKELLLRDYIYNSGKEGYLPAKKEIKNRYGCGERPLTMCIEALISEGLISQHKKKYRISVPQSVDNHSHYIYICGAPTFVQNLRTQHVQFLRAIEILLSEMNWPALRFFLKKEAPLEGASYVRTGSAMHGSAGMIFLGAVDHERAWEPFFMKLGSVPLVFTDIAERQLSFLNNRERCLKVLPDNRYAGNAVGIYLCKSGHRKISLFRHVSMIPKKPCWFELRTQGILEAYAPGSGVCLFDIQKSGEPSVPSGTASAALNVLAVVKQSAAEELVAPEVVSDLATAVYRIRSLRQMTVDAVPFFEDAYSNKAITAWVCINDDLAVAAYQFLKRKGSSRPVELVGFDNTLIAQQLGISSFDFAFDEMGRLAVRFISAPSSILRNRTCSGEIRVKGSLLVRSPDRSRGWGP